MLSDSMHVYSRCKRFDTNVFFSNSRDHTKSCKQPNFETTWLLGYPEEHSALEFNPCAAGGLFDQIKMMRKKLKNDWNPGKWYLSDSTEDKLSNEYQHGRV